MGMMVLQSSYRAPGFTEYCTGNTITRSSSAGNGDQVITIGWEPSILLAIGDDINEARRGSVMIAGKTGGGSIAETTARYDKTLNLYAGGSSTRWEIYDPNTGDGWDISVAFGSTGYTLTWTKLSNGLDVDLEILAIKAKNVKYISDSRTTTDSTGGATYSSIGFDPDIVFCAANQSTNAYSVGWGIDSSGKAFSVSSRGSLDFLMYAYLGFQALSGSPYNGWSGSNFIMGSDQFQMTWNKIGTGATVNINMWAIEFDKRGDWFEQGSNPTTKDIITGLSFTPVTSFSGNWWNFFESSFGIKTQNRQMCVQSEAYAHYYGTYADIRREGPDQSTNYFEVDETFSSEKVSETVTTHGSPGTGHASRRRHVVTLGSD